MPQFWLHGGLAARLLAPLGWTMAGVATARRALYRRGVLVSARPPVPVVVVGNIFVGGTGKTPLVAWLCERLQRAGRSPGIVLRGYGGTATTTAQAVTADSDPTLVGDEAVLLARRTGLPVAAGVRRVEAVELLVAAGCDVIVSDDGLQHYALQRDLEIAVVDAARGLGNGRCLPAGPLREPPARLAAVDLVIANGSGSTLTPYSFTLAPEPLRPLRPEFAPEPPRSGPVHAVAGIGNPQRFFEHLHRLGFEPIAHAFPDHHRYRPADLAFDDALPILMTEKDAVKVLPFATERHWIAPVRAVPTPETEQALEALLTRI